MLVLLLLPIIALLIPVISVPLRRRRIRELERRYEEMEESFRRMVSIINTRIKADFPFHESKKANEVKYSSERAHRATMSVVGYELKEGSALRIEYYGETAEIWVSRGPQTIKYDIMSDIISKRDLTQEKILSRGVSFEDHIY